MSVDSSALVAVVQALEGLPLAPNDGVRAFNTVYTAVTREVLARVNAGAFEDPPFMVILDAAFAGLYLSAVRDPIGAPRAWRVLFDKRFASGIAALRFALAGMNAHINRDLAVALDAAATSAGGAIERGTPRCRDFLIINDILADLMDQAKTELFSSLDREVDSLFGKVDDLFEIWSIRAARDEAWNRGQVLHAMVDPEERQRHVTSIDRSAALVGRLLLI